MHLNISLFLILAGIWFLLSAMTDPLLLSLGALSSALVVWIAHRMDIVDHEGHPIHFNPWRLLHFWVVLIGKIVQSNIEVIKLVFHPQMPISPTLTRVTATQETELGKVIYANSITLTPGTISLEVDDTSIDVHCLCRDYGDDLRKGELDRHVSRIETGRDHPVAETED